MQASQERSPFVSPHKPTAAGISDKKMMESIFAQYPQKRLNEDQFIAVISTPVPLDCMLRTLASDCMVRTLIRIIRTLIRIIRTLVRIIRTLFLPPVPAQAAERRVARHTDQCDSTAAQSKKRLAYFAIGKFLMYDRPKLSKLFHEIDSNHNGTVEWEEMLAFITERAATYQKK